MPASTTLRVAHGVSATIILALFLLAHITNHLLGLIGPDTHASVMKLLRHVYRARLVEPTLVALFLFQISSGLLLARQLAAKPSDPFKTYQLASGIYLLFFVPGHMNSVFLYARLHLGIDTAWDFATGAPAGLIRDAWNIRLVPHYALGVFFALSHLCAGARVVILKHGVRLALANRLMIGGCVVSGVVAALTLSGMCGLRI